MFAEIGRSKSTKVEEFLRKPWSEKISKGTLTTSSKWKIKTKKTNKTEETADELEVLVSPVLTRQG